MNDVNEVVTAYRKLSESREFREMERQRDKAERDEASRLYNAERKAALKIAKKLLALGDSIDKIAIATGLDISEIEKLNQKKSK